MASPERHSRRCTVCASPNREAIETAYLAWQPPSQICRQFRIRCKSSFFIHVQTLGLTIERDKNIKRALASLIEKNIGRKLSGAALVSAIATFARIDADGRDAARLEYSQPTTSFAGWTVGELRSFVESGTWPERFPRPNPDH